MYAVLLASILGVYAESDWLSYTEKPLTITEDTQKQIVRKGDKCFAYLDGAVYNLSPLFDDGGYEVKTKSGKVGYTIYFDIC